MNTAKIIGNLSTIIKIIIITIFPAITVYMADDALLAGITAIIGLLFSFIDAKYPNTIVESPELEKQNLEEAGDDGI